MRPTMGFEGRSALWHSQYQWMCALWHVIFTTVWLTVLCELRVVLWYMMSFTYWCSIALFPAQRSQQNPNDVVNPYHLGPASYRPRKNVFSQGYKTRRSNFLTDQDIALSKQEYQEILKDFDPSFKHDVTASATPRNFFKRVPRGKDLQGHLRMMALRKYGLQNYKQPLTKTPTTYSYGSYSPNGYSITSGYNFNNLDPYQAGGMGGFLDYNKPYPQLHDISGTSLYQQRFGNQLNSVRNPRLQGKSLLGNYFDMVGLSDYDRLDPIDYYKNDGNENYGISVLPVPVNTTPRPTSLGLYRESAVKLGKLVLDHLKIKT